MKRAFSRLVPLLVAAQLLLSAPVAGAWADQIAAPVQGACAGMDPGMPAGDDCPCCTDEGGVAGCLSNCLASQAAAASTTWPRFDGAPPTALPPRVTSLPTPADPPVKPPPID